MRESFGVVIPDQQVCPQHSTPWRAFAEAYFATVPVSVWKSSRGLGGKTYLMAILALTEAIALQANVTILGGSAQQSERVIAEMERMWRYPSAPTAYLKSEPGRRYTECIWNNAIVALAASQTSVRGAHPSRLRCDEVDEMKLSILDAATGQPMRHGLIKPQTVLSSTHQYADGTMTEVLKRATDRGWSLQEWCWRETSCAETGWVLPVDIETKRLEVTDVMWQTEYDLQEPNPEARAIDQAAIERMFDPTLGIFAGRDREFVGVQSTNSGARYAHGADWAKKTDWTCLVTLRTDTTPMRLAAFQRMRRQPWPAMIGAFDARLRTYHGPACHDALGIGDVVAGYLKAIPESPIEDVLAVGRTRHDLFTEYIAAIERHEIIAPRIQSMYGEHKYVMNEDLYGAGHPPDTFVAGAMAYRASRRRVLTGAPIGHEGNPYIWDNLGPLGQQPSIFQIMR